jgi:hypothetical protein
VRSRGAGVWEGVGWRQVIEEVKWPNGKGRGDGKRKRLLRDGSDRKEKMCGCCSEKRCPICVEVVIGDSKKQYILGIYM